MPELLPSYRFSVAPMLNWTDRHCRYFHRQISQHSLLYTEMVVANGIVRGDPVRMLRHRADEYPLALQLGGSEPEILAEATRIAAQHGYAEINLNVGCPSDRVQNGAFGACLMREPALVAECFSAMQRAAYQNSPHQTPPEITIKCRIGVDDQDPEQVLPHFIDTLATAGCRRFIIHARKAWLKGLSPKENRMIPPLDYALPLRLKQTRPELVFVINGGIDSFEAAQQHLTDGFDGVMIGRAAYHAPYALLSQVDRTVFGAKHPPKTPEEILHAMTPYIAQELAQGSKMHLIGRHMLGLFAGQKNARNWRRVLTETMHQDGAGAEVLETALHTLVYPFEERL